MLNSTKSALELEYETLEILKHQLHQLHHEVLRKERDILHIINQDFTSCSGVKCYLQTALKKAPDFFELFKTHFRHGAKNATGFDDCFWSANSSRTLTGHQPETSDTPFDLNQDHNEKPPSNFDGIPPSDNPFDFDGSPPPPPPPPPMNAPFDFDEANNEGFPNFDDDDDDDETAHHSSYNPTKPSDVSTTYHGHKPHHERPPFRMPHPAPRPRHYKLILATAGLVVSILISTILFKGLRIYCANPRVRAERAARIEECRTKREYRKAACQHRIRQCLSRFRRRPRARSTDDYEEKRAMLRARNANAVTANAENHIIGTNIASLRRATELVSQLMLAEEGRSFSFANSQPQRQHSSPLPPPEPQPSRDTLPSSSRSIRSIRSIRTTTTLPPYAPPPPRYSQELSRDIHIVDGFRYTPTQSDATLTSSASSFIIDDDATESSVVDCISRLSIATETEADTDAIRGRRKQSLELAGDRYRGQFD